MFVEGNVSRYHELCLQAFDLLVDCIFMVDIALCFITCCDNQGFVIHDFRVIASIYARSWLFPDFAGSLADPPFAGSRELSRVSCAVPTGI